MDNGDVEVYPSDYPSEDIYASVTYLDNAPITWDGTTPVIIPLRELWRSFEFILTFDPGLTSVQYLIKNYTISTVLFHK